MLNAHRFAPLPLCLLFALPALGSDPTVEEIEITGRVLPGEPSAQSTERRLTSEGVDFSAAGGVSALPVLNGLGADRVKVLIDGAESGVACANQMNPPLSYISGSQIETLAVMAGISPVSVAGDNIAGVISVNAIEPRYTDSDQLTWQSGYLAGAYRSNGDARQISLGARAASDSISLAYSGAFDDSKSYEDGRGERVLDTLYRAQNHSLVGAWRDDSQQLAMKLSHQYIPYQGYPNQYMDMTENRSTGLMAHYERKADDGREFHGQLNVQQVEHAMGFFTEEKPGSMPMNTEADEVSYKLRWHKPLNDQHTLLLGHEYHYYQLNDWWPAVEGSMMMGPNDYRNITDGERERVAGYAELRSRPGDAWTLISGVRVESVRTDAGKVQAYNSMPMMGMPNVDHQAAQAFNAADRERRDTNVDLTLLARFQWSEAQSLEAGIARKQRSPNLYERYSWGRGVMASTMVGWFGDGNGYVGRIDLEPETAYTLSARYRLGAEDSPVQLSISPYYTEVDDYVDVDLIGTFNRGDSSASERHLLQFSNQDVTLYGLDVDARYRLTPLAIGQFSLEGALDYRRGERDRDGEPVYQIPPLSVQFALAHTLDNWENRLTVEWVDEKDRVDRLRKENTTGQYTLVNLSTRYEWERVTLSLGVDNLLDEYYEQPLGGVSIAAFRTGASEGFDPVAGAGRSLNAGVRYRF